MNVLRTSCVNKGSCCPYRHSAQDFYCGNVVQESSENGNNVSTVTEAGFVKI